MMRTIVFTLALGWFFANYAAAQDPGVEVLARGPIHEAYASTAEFPAPGPVVAKLPPQPVEELPPDQKPDGENVQWLPGYWHFDEDRADYIWISGFWRVPPPGRVWVPGNWHEVRGGWQWTAGFWQMPAPARPQAVAQTEIQYLPQPPVALELMPSIPAPTVSSFYVPGSWVWRGHYVWRPGFWMDVRQDWVWVPAQYRYTPGGYIYVEGYWDYTLAQRGVLFAPVYFDSSVIGRRSYVYTPSYCISNQAMFTALFIRRGQGSYWFGDYYAPRYANAGYTAWCGTLRGTNFAISVGYGRGATYDPLWAHYQAAYRNDPQWIANINDTYAGRFRGDLARPPQTLVQQNNIKIVNNTNTVVNNTTIVNNINMVAPLSAAAQTNSAVRMQAVPQAERVREQEHSRQLQNVSFQRQKLETNLAARAPEPGKLPEQPRQAKLEVPQQLIARAQVTQEPKKAPPQQPKELRTELRNQPTPPVKPEVKPAPLVTPLPTPKPEPKPPVVLPPPKGDPKPVPVPKGDPKPVPVPPQPVPPPKGDPKPVPVPPQPVPPPKGDPKPVPPPKIEPRPVPVPPQPVPPPKIEPRPLPVPPQPAPPPKPVPVPPQPVPPPKGEPKPIPVPVPPPSVPIPPSKPGEKPGEKKPPEKKKDPPEKM